MHGADALAAARCAWGAEGSLGQRPNVPEAAGQYKRSAVAAALPESGKRMITCRNHSDCT